MKESEGTPPNDKNCRCRAQRRYVLPETAIQDCRLGILGTGNFVLNYGLWFSRSECMGSHRFPDRWFLLRSFRFSGDETATYASARTANAARSSLNSGLRIAFRSGAVMGLVVVGLGLLDISFWYLLLNAVIPADALTPTHKLCVITTTMLTFGMGASTQALFAVSVVVSIQRLPMSEPTWWVRWKPESPKTTRATLPLLPICR